MPPSSPLSSPPSPAHDLTVLVPLAAGERAWLSLVEDLAQLPEAVEVRFASPELPPTDGEDRRALTELSRGGRRVAWDVEPGACRGIRLNRSAARARGEWLWILHADVRLNDEVLTEVSRALAVETPPTGEAVYFFDLEFERGAPRRLSLNALATGLRAHLAGLPDGRQGYLLRATSFRRAGGFPEDGAPGDDLRFIQRARAAGVRARGLDACLRTSSRGYAERGWLRATLGKLGRGWRRRH